MTAPLRPGNRCRRCEGFGVEGCPDCGGTGYERVLTTHTTIRIGSVDLSLASTSTPGLVLCQRYRGGRPLGAPSVLSLGEVTAEAVVPDAFAAAVAAGVEHDPFADVDGAA